MSQVASPLTEAYRRVTGRSPDVAGRVDGLERAANAARGRLDDRVVDEAQTVVDRAGARLRLSGEHTVVALAGSTGSGKSSLFNAMCGLNLAPVGVKRPTTSWTLACSWGPDGAGPLLEWLGIPTRHQVNRMSLLDKSLARADGDLAGLVLLDLPDHDSTEVSHHLEVERLVGLADLLVWVVDPQKYADAAVHDRFLRRLSSHADVMMVVLNHVDELPAGAAARTVDDLKRLLKLDGLDGVPVFPTSAVTEEGLSEFRRAIIDRVAQKRYARARLLADVKAAATRLAADTGGGPPAGVPSQARGELLDACADAAGVPVVVQAIEAASKMRARQATGWPVTKWLGRFKPDPLKRLHLDVFAAGDDRPRISRTSLPQATPVQRARVDAAVRAVAAEVSAETARPWAAAVRAASVSRLDDFADRLDTVVASTDLGVARDPRWWRAVRSVQWVLFVVAVAGALWLAVLAGFAYLQLPRPATPGLHGAPIPTAMVGGGVVLGLLVAGVCRVLARVSAARRARRARQRLRAEIGRAADELVVQPIQAELDAYAACRDGLAIALGG